MQVKKKSVLVTAGASGIGSYIASSFHHQGCDVHIADVDDDALDKAQHANPEFKISQCDVALEDEVNTLAQSHIDSFEGIDVLVNCAGIAGPTGLIEDLEFEDWHRCLGVNLDATFLCCKALLPAMKRKRAGRIINLSSTAGWHGYPLRTPYAAAKWAVIGLTKSIAMEVGQYGITVNAICPGSVDGERMDRVIAAEAAQKGVSEDDIRKEYTMSCSMRTFISGQDIADMAVFLASEQASRVSGQIMNVDGHLEGFATMDDLDL